MIRTTIYHHRYNLLASFLILCAIGFRLFLIAHNWPVSDSEEGTMALEALHIAFRGEHPIYLYGQNYMGVGEAYLGAVMFHLFGVSIFSLRLGMLLLFSLFLLLIYVLGSFLYGKKVACIALLLMIGGAQNVLIPELKAVGGDVETLVCGSFMLLLASWLAFSHMKTIDATKRFIWQRRCAYGGWGLAVGLGLWSHLLVAPFVLCSALLLVFFCRRELRGVAGLFLACGLIIGAMPLIIYNVTAPAGDNTLAVFINLHQTSYPNAPTGVVLWLKRLSGTFLYTLPIATGLPQIISNSVLPLYSPLQSQFLPAILLYGIWSVSYLVLLSGSTWYILKRIVLLRRKEKAATEIQPSERQKLVLYTARLMLLLCGWLTILSYLSSTTAAQRPWSFRYLIGLMIVLPALIAPLVNRQIWTRYKWQKVKNVVSSFLIIVMLGVSVIGTMQSISFIPDGNTRMQQQQELINVLLQAGVTRIYSGYWVCDAINFQSREKIICAVLDNNMQPGLTRYLPYKSIVNQSKNVAYVFTENGDFHPQNAIQSFASNHSYEQLRLSNYIVFVPL